MNIAIVLAGGNGNRMRLLDSPKQYVLVGNRPVICYCLDTFQKHEDIDAIFIVAKEEWKRLLEEWIIKENITKFGGFVTPGTSRQHSIYNGLLESKKIAKKEGIVIIHDAARPLVSKQIITNCIKGAFTSDGAMPVIKVNDTIYHSKEGNHIDGLLSRDELYAGQSPESFKLDQYLAIHEKLKHVELSNIRGSSEIAYRFGMNIELVEGSEENFKITTMEDMEKFRALIEIEEN